VVVLEVTKAESVALKDRHFSMEASDMRLLRGKRHMAAISWDQGGRLPWELVYRFEQYAMLPGWWRSTAQLRSAGSAEFIGSARQPRDQNFALLRGSAPIRHVIDRCMSCLLRTRP
jgi:hypothetical protein